MRITAAKVIPYRLPFARTWQSAAGSLRHRSGCLLRLDTDAGYHGWGECAPLPGHGTEPETIAATALERYSRALPGNTPEDGLCTLPPAPSAHPAARSASECALLDLIAQAHGLPLWRLLGATGPARPIPLSAMAGPLNTATAADLAALVAAGFRIIKFKAGLAPISAELDSIDRLLCDLPAHIQLRLDANRAWPYHEARQILDALSPERIDSIEEPLAAPDLEQLRALQASTGHRLALDESWPELLGTDELAKSPVQRLILRPPVCGGPLAAMRMAAQAIHAGCTCVVASSLESACGLLCAAHLAAALPAAPAHGLATTGWLAEDTGRFARVEGASIAPQEAAGLGFTADSRANSF